MDGDAARRGEQRIADAKGSPGENVACEPAAKTLTPLSVEGYCWTRAADLATHRRCRKRQTLRPGLALHRLLAWFSVSDCND